MLCPLEWTLEEGFVGIYWKDCVWGLNAVWCLPAQPVMLWKYPSGISSQYHHSTGGQWELTWGLFLSIRSSSCGDLLTPGLSTLILSPCSHLSACGIWAESSPPCFWKGGWFLLQTSSGTLLRFLKLIAAMNGRLRRLQRLISLLSFFFSALFQLLIWCE